MISLSGIDCGGKSTQIEKLKVELEKKGFKCKVIHSRGGYTPVLEFFKTLIRKDKNGTAEEHEKYREKVHGSSRKRRMLLWLSIFDLGLFYGVYFRISEMWGNLILADRYIWDSYIDFVIKYPEFEFEKWKVWKIVKRIFLKPTHSIIYTIPAELSMYRSTLKDEPWPEPIEVRRERIDRYMSEIELGRWKYVIDATASVEEVFEETMRVIEL